MYSHKENFMMRKWMLKSGFLVVAMLTIAGAVQAAVVLSPVTVVTDRVDAV